jgi:hypothetical protein
LGRPHRGANAATVPTTAPRFFQIGHNSEFNEAPMLYYVLKIAISAAVIVAVSEIAKRHSAVAALVAALPLTSLLAFVWLHLESTPNERIAQLSFDIFWLTLPSLALFLALPLLLRNGWGWWPSLGLAVGATIVCYLGLLPLLRRLGNSP